MPSASSEAGGQEQPPAAGRASSPEGLEEFRDKEELMGLKWS